MDDLTINDLIDAKKDLDHIAEVANSSNATATDRLGNIKDTVKGAVDTLKAFNSRGEWAPATAYAIKDLIFRAGTWYVCVLPHTSSADFTADNTSNWRVHQGVTVNGIETLENKSFTGQVSFLLNGETMAITSENTPPPDVGSLIHIVNNNSAGTGITVASMWQGSTAAPYVNNDTVLCETYNRTLSNSANRSWGASCSNAYHDIPAGVTDSGTRVGVIGWAVSVYGRPGYVHAGTLESQTGVWGSAGFQSAGTPPTAVINEACGVRGIVYADAVGATIKFARAGAFASDGVVGGSIIEENAALVARAKNGTVSNYSFYGEAGELYNQDIIFGATQVAAGSKYSQSVSKFAARYAGNSFEFGYPDTGYGSNIGATFSSGTPFVAFSAEADPTGDTFRTRGKPGSVILSNLGGAMIFGRIMNPNASGQNLTEDARFTENGQLMLNKRPILPSAPPASAGAAGQAGEVTYDSNYIYVCVATNTWKRIALSAW